MAVGRVLWQALVVVMVLAQVFVRLSLRSRVLRLSIPRSPTLDYHIIYDARAMAMAMVFACFVKSLSTCVYICVCAVASTVGRSGVHYAVNQTVQGDRHN